MVENAFRMLPLETGAEFLSSRPETGSPTWYGWVTKIPTSNSEGRIKTLKCFYHHLLQFSRINVSGCDASAVYFHSLVLNEPGPSTIPWASDQIRTNSTLITPLVASQQCCTHKARLTLQYRKQQGISLLLHPPHSLALAPCEFWLFPKIKAAIAGKQFHHFSTNSQFRAPRYTGF